MHVEPDQHAAAEAYRRRFAGAVGAWFLARQAQVVRRMLARPGIRTVLDVGGGHAQLTRHLFRAGLGVVTTGSSLATGHLFHGRTAGAGFVAASSLRLPFRSGTFDAVVSVRMMAHMEDPAGFLVECGRVARRCVVIDYAPAGGFNALGRVLFGVKRAVEGNTRPFSRFPRDAIRRFAEIAGLRVAAEEGLHFWPMVLHRLHGSVLLGRSLEALPGFAGLTRRFGSPRVVLCVREG